MSRNGVGSTVPLRTTRIVPARSTTNTRVVSRGGAVTLMGAVKSPTFTSTGAAAAAPGAASAAMATAAAAAALVIRDMAVRRARAGSPCWSHAVIPPTIE